MIKKQTLLLCFSFFLINITVHAENDTSDDSRYLEKQLSIYKGEPSSTEPVPFEEPDFQNINNKSYQSEYKKRILIGDSFPPFKQRRGSCVGHAVALAFSYELAKEDSSLDFKYYKTEMLMRLANPYWVWDKQILGDGSEGASTWSALKILKYHGCPRIRVLKLPKNDEDAVITWRSKDHENREIMKGVVSNAAQYRLESFRSIKNLGQIKKAIDEDHLVLMGIRCGKIFMKRDWSNIWSLKDRIEDWHAPHFLIHLL